MITRYIKKRIFAIAALAFVGIACTQMDEYRNFVPDGEITYTGKVDSVQTFSGNRRVMIQGLLISDPKITQVAAYWNDYRDTMLMDVDRSEGVDTVRMIIDSLEENTWNFILYTYDEEGNTSVPVYAVAQSYGTRYIASLSNRLMYQPIYEDGTLTAEWSETDYLEGIIGTEVYYTNTSNEEEVFWQDASSSDALVLDNYKDGALLKYRSLYVPDTTCVDTFYTDFTEISVMKDITDKYLVNPSSPYEYVEMKDDRWAVPSKWTVSDDVRNVIIDGVGYGGWDNLTLSWNGNGVLSFESGWGNLPAIPNGKIYQTTTLPAGDYRFEYYMPDNGHNGSDETYKYCVVSAGTELPDVNKVTSEAIAFQSVGDDKKISNTLSFTLTEETEISIGWVCKFSSNQTWLKIQWTKLMGYE